MKINDNGIIRDMNPEEIAEYEKMQAELPSPTPSLEEIVEQQAKEISSLKEELKATKILLGVEV